MNKVSNIVLIVLLSILVALLTGVLFYGINGNGFKNKKVSLQQTSEYELSEVNEVQIKAKSADINIKESEDDKVHVEVYTTEKDNAVINMEDGSLKIELKNEIRFCLFCFRSESERIIVKLPSSYSNGISIDSKSGDVEISSFENAVLNISTRSGDLKADSIKDANISLTSGDIYIKKINTANIKATSGDIELIKIDGIINLKVTSGDIEIKDFDIKGDSKIVATSGDVKIKNLSDAFVSTSVKSGDIKVNGSNRSAEYELDIKVTSGDIKVN